MDQSCAVSSLFPPYPPSSKCLSTQELQSLSRDDVFCPIFEFIFRRQADPVDVGRYIHMTLLLIRLYVCQRWTPLNCSWRAIWRPTRRGWPAFSLVWLVISQSGRRIRSSWCTGSLLPYSGGRAAQEGLRMENAPSIGSVIVAFTSWMPPPTRPMRLPSLSSAPLKTPLSHRR